MRTIDFFDSVNHFTMQMAMYIRNTFAIIAVTYGKMGNLLEYVIKSIQYLKKG